MTTPAAPLYPTILAGGSGKRFWPLSRRKAPKHFLPILGEKFLLLQSVERVLPISGWERIYVVTVEDQWGDAASLLPNVPRENILCEPMGKNTAASVGLAALNIRRRDPDGVMVVLPSDHYIRDVEKFTSVLIQASHAAASGNTLVLLGVVPTRPETGYGYIETGKEIKGISGFEMYHVSRFHEKPSRDRAEDFLKTGSYLWNAGVFVWKAEVILKAMQRTMPGLFEGLQRIEGSMEGPYERKTTREVYSSLPPVSVDTGVLEKLQEDLVVVRVDFGWSDVGSFISLSEVLERDGDGNVIRGQHVGLDSSGNIILGGKRLIATVGVKDMIIVETGDVVLVCSKDRAQEVKELVDTLEKTGRTECL